MDPVVHFDIPADEPKRALAFYQAVFGWRVWQNLGGDENHPMVSTAPEDETGNSKVPGTINGDIFQRTPDYQHPCVVVRVDNMDEKLKLIEANGGKALGEKIQLGDWGSYIYILDTENNQIQLFEPASRPDGDRTDSVSQG